MTLPVTADDVASARRALTGRVRETPVFASRVLSDLCGTRVALKAELLQRTGSFKPRGAFSRLGALTADERRRGVITLSAGNHAQAVALAAGAYDVAALVLMPRDASSAKVAATRAYGATVDLDSADTGEALARMQLIAEQSGRVIVHPYDDPLVIAGQGTVGMELVEQLPDLDVVVVPVGGGGLVSGVAVAVKAQRPAARIIGVEPQRAATLRSAFRGEPSPTLGATIADALRAPAAGVLCATIARALLDDVVTVTDAAISDAMRLIYSRAKLACEPGAAIGVAALLSGLVDAADARAIAVVISGGNVSSSVAAAILNPASGS
jgi:threonine dehydratase